MDDAAPAVCAAPASGSEAVAVADTDAAAPGENMTAASAPPPFSSWRRDARPVSRPVKRDNALMGSLVSAQAQDAERLGYVEGGLPRRTPRVIRARVDAADAIETGTQLEPGTRRGHAQRGERNPHGAVPDLRVVIDARGNREPGVPGHALLPILVVAIDVEVDPLALRRHLV